MIFDTQKKQKLLVIKHACVMPSNNHNTFGLSPFLVNNCQRESHVMHECVNIDRTVNDRINMHIKLVRTRLDHGSLNIVALSSSNEIHHRNEPIPEWHRATMTASLLNKALPVHEKELHYSFFLDFKLSQSGQAMSITNMQQLDTYCPICNQCKITRSVTAPGGAFKTKNITTIGRNNDYTS